MDYAKPVLRQTDVHTAAASCTPCPARKEDVYVSWDYTQVTPWFGLCNTVAPGVVDWPCRSAMFRSGICGPVGSGTLAGAKFSSGTTFFSDFGPDLGRAFGGGALVQTQFAHVG